MTDHTVVEYRSTRSGYHCGYCGSDASKISYGMPTEMMTCRDYQDLIDRGWRRSGTYCYKPVMDQTCCPQYTIRCKALEYKLTKSKKKVLSKMRKFLMSEGDEEIRKWRSKFYSTDKDASLMETELTNVSCTPSQNTESTKVEARKEPNKGLGADPTKPPCKKAKLLRQERKQLQSCSNPIGGSLPVMKDNDKIKDLRCQIPHLNHDLTFKRRLEVRMVPAMVGNKEFEATRKESHSVYQRYQHAIHGDHFYECNERQWLRFLVKSALHRDSDGPGPGYGNYHQQYVLDGKIIAVGVVDVLPNCLSSVYLYYDPDYGFLSLGIYSALSEIAYTQSLYEECDALKYYYMGFYIHSCQKMKYKGEYPPSDLLCPQTYEWVSLGVCKTILDETKYSRLNLFNKGSCVAVDPHSGDGFNFDEIGILYRGVLMQFKLYKTLKYSALQEEEDENATAEQKWMADLLKQNFDSELKEIKEYVSLVGDVCAKRMFLLRESY